METTCAYLHESATIAINVMRDAQQSNAGFTVVEMLVTVVLAGIFIAFFVQMFRATSAQQSALIRQATANDIARSNLSKFPTVASIAGYTCDTNSSTSANTNNLTINPNAAGTAILSDSQKETDPGTIGTLVQTVRALSPRGCSGSYLPVKIVSTVEYGFTGQRDTVEYATYVF